MPTDIKNLSIGTSRGNCGVLRLDGEMEGEKDFIVFAKLNSSGSYETNLCSGTKPKRAVCLEANGKEKFTVLCK